MKRSYLLIAIALIALISSCKKDSTIGASILPPEDLVNAKYTDTFTLQAKTLADTFLRTDKLSKNYLGIINDSKFGFQKASLVTELEKPNTVYDDTLMTTFTVDSVVLFLKYNSVYGDTSVAQDFKVSTISNPINESNLYFSNTTSFPAASMIGLVNNYYIEPSNKIKVSISDSFGIDGIIRIPVNNSVGTTILSLGQTILRDSTSFKNAFPGIVVENSTLNGKAMASVDFSSLYTGLVIFYKDKTGANKEMRMYALLSKVTSTSVISRLNGINLFSNTLSTSVSNVINSGAVSDSINYIYGQGGSVVKISLPTLSSLGKVAINKASISFTQVEKNSNDELKEPTFLLLLKRNANGLLDILPTNDGVGIIDSTGTDDLGNKISRYSFNISKYVQNISLGLESNSDLYIATYRSGGTDPSVNVLNSIVNGSIINFGYIPSRIIVAGPNYSDPRYKMKLNLTYTLIK